jgi:anaerobic magnesium-protoporphyrin IX monomethyl ester cyclase
MSPAHQKMRKVLLIQPPLTTHIDLSSEPKGVHPPLGLASLAAVLENDYDVQILDCVVEGYETEIQRDRKAIRYGLADREIAQRIEAFRPDVVGVSNLFSSGYREALEVCSLTKKLSPDILTVMGGPHPSALPEETLRQPAVDCVVIGEGEDTFRKLLAGMKSRDFSNLDGIGLKLDGGIRIVPKTRFIENLDELPFPARHLLPMNKYFEIGEAFIMTRRKPFTPMNTSRGCTAQCTFCPVHATWGKRWRSRSAENVLSEIEQLVADYGVREIHFDDDNLVLNRRRAQQIFQGIIDRKLDITWTVPPGLALWAVDDELLELMKASGCYKLYVAAESGDECILRDVIQKPLDLKMIGPLVRTMKRLGIEVETFFVVGMPGETTASLRRTFEFARRLDADATHYFFANPMPGTKLWDICVQGGYFRENFRFEDIRVERANINIPGLPADRLEHLVAREQLASRALALARHPVRMAAKYISYFKKDRRIVANFLLRNVRTVLGRGSHRK